MEKSDQKKRKYKKRRLWSEKEEELLVQLWEERIDQLRGQRKNSHVLKEMKEELNRRNIDVSIQEIQYKIHNLTSRYRTEKKKIGSSGGSPSTWSLYNKIHLFIGGFKSNNIELLMEDSIIDASDHLLVSTSHLEISQYDELSSHSLTGTEFASKTLNMSTESSSSLRLEDPDIADSVALREHSSNSRSRPVEATPQKRQKMNNFQSQVLKEIRLNNEKLNTHFEQSKRNDEKLIALEEKLVSAEERRNVLLEKMIADSEIFQNSMLNFLNSKQN